MTAVKSVDFLNTYEYIIPLRYKKKYFEVHLLKIPHSNDDYSTRTCPRARVKFQSKKSVLPGVFPEGNELLVWGNYVDSLCVHN
jgi:hypothetical protein